MEVPAFTRLQAAKLSRALVASMQPNRRVFIEMLDHDTEIEDIERVDER
jgi:hypothetical protein